MDIAILMNEVEKARLAILNGQVYQGIHQIHRLRREGYQVDSALVEDILDIPSLIQYLYDETYIGDAVNATRCLAALKELGAPVDSRKINYIRFKKLSLMNVPMERYIEHGRPEFKRLIKTLRSFFTNIGDFRECVLHKTENRLTFEEEVVVRFPNLSFRDIFLQVAFQQAIEKGLSFYWENHHSIHSQELTGRISWSLIQPQTQLPSDWYHGVKARFDAFLKTLIEKLETLDLPRYFPIQRDNPELMWIIFSRDATVGERISAALKHFTTIQVQDPGLLQKYLQQDEGSFGAFIFYISVRDFDVLPIMSQYKIMRPTMGAPYIVFAEGTFFKIMKDQTQLFPGCEHVTVMNPENVQNLEYIIARIQQYQRRFVRLPLDMECQAIFGHEEDHTRATPISPGGTLVKTHRIVPVFSRADITLKDPAYGFEESVTGTVVYNTKGGSAVEFDNIIPYEKFRQLREISLARHIRIVDTLKRSSI